MDRSSKIGRLASVRMHSLPAPPPPLPGLPGRPQSRDVFFPLLPSYLNKYESFSSMGILELFPICRGSPLPSIDQAKRILERNFPRPLWQEEWVPMPCGQGKFLLPFSSRSALLRAFQCGVLWGQRFSCSIRPWSFREGGSPAMLSFRVVIKLRNLPLLLSDPESIQRLVSGFGVVEGQIPELDLCKDFSAAEFSILCVAVEDIPSNIAATLANIRYVIPVDILDFDAISPPSPVLPLRVEGEPDWEEFDGTHHLDLDDASDPIDLDTDPAEESSPSEGVDSSSRASEDPEPLCPVEVSASHRIVLRCRASSSPWALLKWLEEAFRLFSLSSLQLEDVTPSLIPKSFHSILAFAGAQRQVSPSLPSVSLLQSPSLSRKIEIDSASARSRSQQQRPLKAPHKSHAGIFTVRKAKKVQPKKPKFILPLRSIDRGSLIAWGRACGFLIPDHRADAVVHGILELERAKASNSQPVVDPRY